jgi:cell division protein FtsQ
MRRLSLPRRGLQLAAAGVLALILAAALWVRDSSLVQIEQVTVAGVSGPDAPKIEAALRDAARDMTTLRVRDDQLRRAVAGFPTVGDLRVDRELPHTVRIEVVERTPVAVVVQGEEKIPVTAEGSVLRGATADDALPVLDVAERIDGRIDGRRPRQVLAVLGAAPRPLLLRTEGASFGAHGLTLALSDGPEVHFGTTEDVEGKWAAAARVLADPAAAGAEYVDVRVPDRVAAGGLAVEPEPVDPAATDDVAPVDPAAADAPTADPALPAPTDPTAAPVVPPVPAGP